MKFLWITLLGSCSGSDPERIEFLVPPVSNFGRDLGKLSTDHLNKLDPILKNFIEKQNLVDELCDANTPQFTANRMEETMHNETLSLLYKLASSTKTVSFRTSNNRTLIYTHDCEPGFSGFTWTAHPLLVEAAYTNYAASLGLANPVIFVSPPAPLPLVRNSSKLDFQMSDPEYTQCFFSGGTVRFAVLQGVREPTLPLAKMIQGHRLKPLREAISIAAKVGVTLIQSLAVLHGKNLLHGNLNLRNIYVRKLSSGDLRPLFGNFRHAMWTDGLVAKTVRGFMSARMDVVEMSPWEMYFGTDHSYTKRDDVFRVIQTVASLMFGTDAYFGQQRNMTRSELIAWKKYGDIFSLPMKNSKDLMLSSGIDRDFYHELEMCFKNIQMLVRSSGIPEYARLARLLMFVDKKTRKASISTEPIPPAFLIPQIRNGDTPERTPGEEIHLGNSFDLGRSYRVSFIASIDPPTTIAYFHDCDGMGRKPVHPAARSFFAFRRFSVLGIAPTPMWLSKPVPLSPARTRKTNFALTDEEYQRCVAANATVQYVVMSLSSLRHDDLRVPVQNLVKTGSFNFTEAMWVGAALVSSIKRMHSLNMGHGYINKNQFTLLKFRDDDWSTLSIDGFEPDHWIWQSPWEMRNHTYSKRDDVYRAIEAVSALLNGDALESHFIRMSRDNLIHFKTFEFVFRVPSLDGRGLTQDNLTRFGMDSSVAHTVYAHLGAILAQVRQAEPNLINYDYIIHLFRSLAEMDIYRSQPKSLKRAREW